MKSLSKNLELFSNPRVYGGRHAKSYTALVAALSKDSPEAGTVTPRADFIGCISVSDVSALSRQSLGRGIIRDLGHDVLTFRTPISVGIL